MLIYIYPRPQAYPYKCMGKPGDEASLYHYATMLCTVCGEYCQINNQPFIVMACIIRHYCDLANNAN